VGNRAAARALRADPRLDGLVLLPSFGGHPDGAWLEPEVAVIGLSRNQAQMLGRAYGQLAVYELDGTIRRVVARPLNGTEKRSPTAVRPLTSPGKGEPSQRKCWSDGRAPVQRAHRADLFPSGKVLTSPLRP
jgi:hypothetical protein